MSIDRLQSRQGVFVVSAEPGFTVASSLSSVGSNQFPGGYQFGSQAAILGAASGSLGGGAFVVKPTAGVQTFGGSSGTSAYITFDNAAVVLASLSAGGLHNVQPPAFDGQMLTIVNRGGSASFVTGAILSGQGTGSTTTAVIPTVFPATTVSASGARIFCALSTLGGSASNSTTAVWHCIG